LLKNLHSYLLKNRHCYFPFTTASLTEVFQFQSEGNDRLSPQEILANNPEIICNIPELEIGEISTPLIIRELSTNRGSIDILYITSNSDIIIIETKLYRNPESHRAVVAQVIDYVKALTQIDVDSLLNNALNSQYSDNEFKPDDYFISALRKNIVTGNFSVVIVGDNIHPNILGMTDSIQSAPHLAFTIYLVELAPRILDDNTILINPRLISKTNEVERSVIKLEISMSGSEISIDSSIPEKESKGSKPILSEEEYYSYVEKPEIVPIIRDFITSWRKKGGDIHMGTVGLSAGFEIEGRRIPIQQIYQKKVLILTERWKSNYGIDDVKYNNYKNYFKQYLPHLYDKYLIGNHVEVKFANIDSDELKKILNASFLIIENL